MSGVCAECNAQCSFRDPPKNPGDVFGFPCDWCKVVRCKRCSNIGSSEVRAISASSRTIPYICKECAPKLSRIFEIEARVASLENEIRVVQEETKNFATFVETMKTLCEEVKSIKVSFQSSFNELKSEISSVTSSVAMKMSGSSMDGPDIDSVIAEMNDRAERARNIIVHNIEESSSDLIRERIDDDRRKLKELMSLVNKESSMESVVKVVRLGRRSDNKSRPLKVIFSDSGAAMAVLRAANSSTDHACKVNRDLTLSQREYRKKIIEELVGRREAGEDNLALKYRNGIPFIAKVTGSSGQKRKNTE